MKLLFLQPTPKRTTPERTTHNAGAHNAQRRSAQRTTHNAQRTTHNAQRTTHNIARGNDPRIQEVVALLADNLSYPWQIAQLADAVLMSPRQLERRFKAGTGYSPLHYLRQLRLQRAAALLATTFEQINQIAQQVGISDARYFRRSFKEYYGVSPGEYRKQRTAARAQHVVFSPQMSEISPLSEDEMPLR
jgi:transcriptional regulator GlxA family with amidase domain